MPLSVSWPEIEHKEWPEITQKRPSMGAVDLRPYFGKTTITPSMMKGYPPKLFSGANV